MKYEKHLVIIPPADFYTTFSVSDNVRPTRFVNLSAHQSTAVVGVEETYASSPGEPTHVWENVVNNLREKC